MSSIQLPFRYNYHIAKKKDLKWIEREIADYPKQYSTPKYLQFMRSMSEDGWDVRLYVAKVSKYVFVSKGAILAKVRFSNHKPIRSREETQDCDYYVGVSNTNVMTTQEIENTLKWRYQEWVEDL